MFNRSIMALLPRQACRELAEYFQREAEGLHGRADPLERVAAPNTPRHETLRGLATEAAAQRHREALKRAQRDREIMHLAGLGRSNEQIAARFDMHPKSVSQIVRRQILEHLDASRRDLDWRKVKRSWPMAAE